MTSNYPPQPGAPGMTGATTEQMNIPPGMGTVTSSQPPAHDPLSVMRRGSVRQGPASNGWKTTEFGVFVLVALGNLLASALVASNDGRGDVFRADKAWFYITLLAIAYIVSRGLAKIGTRGNRDD
ncbi:MAG TPA: hypothetical protein VGO94_03495 [Mycobacteriales bacterium]|jgi:hypothetical protein|nr:hypothetical protein [Mycobacteriales bacterium]